MQAKPSMSDLISVLKPGRWVGGVMLLLPVKNRLELYLFREIIGRALDSSHI